MDQRCGRRGTTCTEERVTLTVRWLTSSTTSSGVRRTTSYHAPRRTLQFTSPRTRAHCGASGIVAPQELVALTHTRRWPGGAPSTAAALQARDTASRKGLPIGREALTELPTAGFRAARHHFA